MPLFSKRKYTELDDVSVMTEDEREKARISLEMRRNEINAELELLMIQYSRLTKNRKIKRRKSSLSKAPNYYNPNLK
jgi:hypothetical protein